jgi:hypothetical protein
MNVIVVEQYKRRKALIKLRVFYDDVRNVIDDLCVYHEG